MKKNILFIVCISLINSVSFSQKSWEQKADFSGTARHSAISFAINGKGYIGLGQDAQGKKLSDFWEYNPSTNTWTQKANYPGNGLHTCISFVVNGKAYIGLGVSSGGSPQNDLWEYDPGANTWSQKSTFVGASRHGSNAFVIGDTAIIIGGSKGGSPYLNEVWMYIPSTNSWSQKSNFSGGSRAFGVSFVIGKDAYFGTGLSNSTTVKKDMWRYNKSSDTWTSIADFPEALTGAVAFELNNIGYIGTGNKISSITNEFYNYDLKKNKWVKSDSIPNSFKERYHGTSFNINGTTYIGIGYVSTSVSLNDLWAFSSKSSKTDRFKKTKWIELFPNPCSEYLYINILPSEVNKNTYKIIDQQGKVIETNTLDNQTNKIYVDNLPNGIYLLLTEPFISITKFSKY